MAETNLAVSGRGFVLSRCAPERHFGSSIRSDGADRQLVFLLRECREDSTAPMIKGCPMKSFLNRLIKKEDGATMVEYGILLVLVALVAAVGLGALGTNLSTMFNNIATALSGQGTTLP
jgi:pilus assembly protein Flp/PilA